MFAKNSKIILFLLLSSILLIWGTISLQQIYKQKRLDHAMFSSIDKHDATATLKLLEQGANGGARDHADRFTLENDIATVISNLRHYRTKERLPPDPTALVYVYLEALPEFNPPGAAKMGPNIALIQALIKHGAPVDDMGVCGSALSLAVQFENLDSARVLLDSGAHVNLRDFFGETSLFFAAREGNLPALRLLKEHGAVINPRNQTGSTPLIHAAMKGKQQAVAFLLDNGAAVNAASTDGNTPILQAARNHHFEVAKILLDHGASPEVRDIIGETPLCNAAEHGDLRLVRLLVEHGANIEIPNGTAQTPLTLAMRNGKTEVVKYLLGRGAKKQAQM